MVLFGTSWRTPWELDGHTWGTKKKIKKSLYLWIVDIFSRFIQSLWLQAMYILCALIFLDMKKHVIYQRFSKLARLSPSLTKYKSNWTPLEMLCSTHEALWFGAQPHLSLARKQVCSHHMQLYEPVAPCTSQAWRVWQND